MICSFERLIYPKNIAEVGGDGYMVASYKVHEKLPDATGILTTTAKVVGYCLPTSTAVKYNMYGQWEKSKYGMQFALVNYDEVIDHTREGLIAYLSSGLIKGIGQKTAEKIYDTFGDDTIAILDKDPQKLLCIKGISEAKLERICESYMSCRGARDVITALAPHGVTPNKAVRIYKQYGNETLSMIHEHPYELCGMRGIGFKTADAIAQSMGLDPASDERIDAGIMHTLKEAETGGGLFQNSGNLCVPRELTVAKCFELLNTPTLAMEMIYSRIDRLISQKRIVTYESQIYRKPTADSEGIVAACICRMLNSDMPRLQSDVGDEIARAEKNAGVILAAEQKNAVRTCLGSRVSIITGGPGTGKTMLQRIILSVFKRLHPEADILCCAPTGRAARRMEQSTGHPASTIHKALGLLADEDGQFCDPTDIEADLVLVDEISMMDIHLAKYLLSALPEDCQLILIGDADQLPSVGPGAVLSELIACDRIPVVTLDKVYRQDAGSRIAINASLIRHNTLALEEGDDFEIIESADFHESADILAERYLQEVKAHGIDNVVLLSPYRTKTDTGVNALNERLRDLVNEPAADKPECKHGRKLFRLHDKVMQIQNVGDISNGDIGYITGIFGGTEDTVIRVDFGEGRIAEYSPSELDKLDLAYATTVHKSQGSEYDTVLLSLQNAHYVMLKRPLLYTAITRAKHKAIIVGQRQAICVAINRKDAEQRGTNLAKRIQSKIPKLLQQAQ